MNKIAYIFVLLVGIVHVYAEDVECPSTNETCEYHFDIKEKLTMIYKKHLVYAHKGKLFKYDENPGDANLTHVSKIITWLLLFPSMFYKYLE